MNRSSSELCFQRFEGPERLPMSGQGNQGVECNTVVEVEASQPLNQTPVADVDPGEYAVVLKKKLDIYCAAVAKSMGSKDAPLLGLQTSSSAYLVTLNPGVGSKPLNSCSSKELSDENEEDLEGDNDMTGDTNPANAKRMRRMLSNRESARRSRRRKQEHVNELETEVLQLRVENSSLSRRLTDMTQKYNDASVDNRVLKADVETLQAKVKMAEDKVKRDTWLDDELYRSISSISTVTVPCSLQVPPVEISDVEVQSKGALQEPNSDFTCPADVMISRTDTKCQSLKRVASLEFLQRRMSGGSSSCDLNQWDAGVRGDNEALDNPN